MFWNYLHQQHLSRKKLCVSVTFDIVACSAKQQYSAWLQLSSTLNVSNQFGTSAERLTLKKAVATAKRIVKDFML